ncbi:MAG: hypothetical protein FJY82_12725 [Candidatus Aminicenantes bacterium]|nr:hypothetical protein [Candidatus Aminicenantes bacterium]
MAKKPARDNEPWTPADLRKLKTLVKGNTPTRLIARELGRTAGAVYQKASHEGISLKPTNQSPYGRRRGR